MKWHPKYRPRYESMGYKFTKYKDEFEVKVKDLPDSSNVRIVVQCGECEKILPSIKWVDYKKYSQKDGEYYCSKCALKLYGLENKSRATLLKSKSFEQWCYENLSNEYANEILSRWDYERNLKNGKTISPGDVTFGSNGINKKGYWFKCVKNPEHGSELRQINSFSGGHKGCIECTKCNSISTTHPEIALLLINKEDAMKYSSGSGVKVLVKCPNCGYEKKMAINTLIRAGLGCIKCSDHIPYPEKFIFNMLEQINLEFKPQLSRATFDWCDSYQYDFYIPLVNAIIETHGNQHYMQTTGSWGMTLPEIQSNDRRKEKLARANGISNYVIIDCSISDMEKIRAKIMESELPNLLRFDEGGIDWLKCHEAGCSSIIKGICELWNRGITNSRKLADELKIGRCTAIRYLHKGVKLGWCNYNSKEESRKNHKMIHERFGVKVICLTTGEIFESQTDVMKKYGLKSSSYMNACCKEPTKKSFGKHPETGKPLRWMRYDEYLKTIH